MIEYREHEVEWTDEKVARFWDAVSKNKALSESYFTKMVGKEVIQDIEKEIGIQKKNILDYGSGPGYLFKSINDLNYDVNYYALEFSKDSVNKLNELYSNNPKFCEAYYVKNFPSKISRKFDVIISCEVVEHLNDEMLFNFINEAKRLLVKGGYIYITTPNEEPLEMNKVNCPDCGCTFHRWQHVRAWSPQSIRRYMESHGFRTEKVKTLNYLESGKLFFSIKNFVRGKILNRNVRKYNLCYIGQLMD